MPSRHRASGVDSLRAWPHKDRLPHGRRRLPLCQNDEKTQGRRLADDCFCYFCFVKPEKMTKNRLLRTEADPMGAAIRDFHATGQSGRLRVLSPQFDEDEIPVSHLFRTPDELPAIEAEALRLCRGRVLDVGAGAGCHSLALEARGFCVTAIDLSPLSVGVMRSRGVHDARQADFFDPDFCGQFNTILLLMNGAGIAGRIGRLPQFFDRLRALLAPEGQVLLDSSDLSYVFEDEDGVFIPPPGAPYYGEVEFRMVYRHIRGPRFPWLYIDFDTLAHHASLNGFTAKRLLNGAHYDYLARLTPAGSPSPAAPSPIA